MTLKLFQLVLAFSGLFVVITGLDVALGGMQTLGWMGSSDFLEITDQEAFVNQDNHIRFFGGLWAAMGVMLWVFANNPLRWRHTLYAFFILIFAGGLARLASAEFGALFGTDLIGSLMAEILGMPVLALWLKSLD